MTPAETNLTAIDKALDVCEALSRSPRGVALSELARAMGQPASTLHRTLAVLKRRGYVRQDDETPRYGLTLKMLDMRFRRWAARNCGCTPICCCASTCCARPSARSRHPARGEVTYLWRAAADEVAMRTVYGREMPAHCALYFSAAGRRRAA